MPAPDVSNSISFRGPHLARVGIVSFIGILKHNKTDYFENVNIKQRLKSEKLMRRMVYKYS